MRKAFILLFSFLISLGSNAVPAFPTPMVVTQPDGTQLTVRIHGDEFYSYLTTLDGYTVIKNKDGFYNYALLLNDRVVASRVVAHDAGERSAADEAWLQLTGTNLRSKTGMVAARAARQERDKLSPIDISNFKGLVILVEFNDAKFTRSDLNEFYSRMFNEENYTGYCNEDGTPNPYGCFTGSVRDYFHDNSNGLFEPMFDVVGPVQVSYSVNDGNQNAYAIFLQAAELAHDQGLVDYSNYDINQDGRVDLVYFIYADTPSSSDPYCPNHIWPHRSRFSTYNRYDGKLLRDYACSAEYIGSKNYGIFDGIGTICHEFSHVLGLPDLYDTNNEDNQYNGEARQTGEWELMAGGNYQNNARTPVAYSLYDRYATGFADYQILEAEGEYELPPIDNTGKGYILKTKQDKEIFLIENRQMTKWDAYAPGHGMMVARMDSTDALPWTHNSPNGNATRLYYELLRAGQSSALESNSDPFPGRNGVTMLTNDNKPNLKTYAGLTSDWVLYDIYEEGDAVKFKVRRDGTFVTAVEDFEAMLPTTDLDATDVQGSLATWTFSSCGATNTPDSTILNSSIVVAMVKNSTVKMTSDVDLDTYQVTFSYYNPQNVAVRFEVFLSTDEGHTWIAQNNINGVRYFIAPPACKSTIYVPVSVDGPARYRVVCTSGSTTQAGYLDDFTFFVRDKNVKGDVNGDGEVNIADVNALIDFILSGNASDAADVNGDGEVNIADINAIIDIILGGSWY